MTTTTELSLIPSQAMPKPSVHASASKQNPKKRKVVKGSAFSLVPSQVQAPQHILQSSMMDEELPTSDNVDPLLSTPDGIDNLESNSNGSNQNSAKGNKNFKKKKKNSKSKSGKKGKNHHHRKNNSSSNSPNRIRRHGNFPDVHWRCVPMEHLREHPNFVPLPLPETIDRIEKLEDIRRFRQESWQWDAVHEGRCTTSQAVAALGFLEPDAARILGVPRSWHRGGMGAYHRLRRPALRTLEEMNAVLCSGDHLDENAIGSEHEEDSSIWIPNRGTNKLQFAAKYCIPVDENARQQRRQEMRHRYHHSSSFDPKSVRMIWGSIQESTALLTALNYFVQQGGPDTKLCEIGMCGAGVQLEGSKLLLGATPDGLICHPDGRKEVLEVKNHCPFFVPNTRNNNNNRPQSRFNIRPGTLLRPGEDGTQKAGVLPHYVPQLMMEMYCMGPDCQSAIMVRQTATAGALILRIHRDEEWLDEMLYWLQRFQSDFVDVGTPPPSNFFFSAETNDDARARYRKFLDRTIELESKVDLLDHVPNNQIQRANSATPGKLVDLFLD